MDQDEEGQSSCGSLRTPANASVDQSQESDSESVAAAAAAAATVGDSQSESGESQTESGESQTESGESQTESGESQSESGDDGEVFMGINERQYLGSDDDEGIDSESEGVHTGRRVDSKTSCFV